MIDKIKASYINKWHNKKGGYYGVIKTATTNPNRRKNAIYPWVPVVNYRRVTFVNGEYNIKHYKQGCKTWRKCASLELERHARVRADKKRKKAHNARIFAKLRGKDNGSEHTNGNTNGCT